MRIERCYFCSGPIYPGHGCVFVRNDAKMFRFCKSKCHKLFKQKKNPRKTRWTKAFRKSAGKEMVTDSSFDFEKKRNRPIKYDRELVGTAIRVLKRTQEIKERREKDFYETRMKVSKENKKKEALVAIEKEIHLVQAPQSLLKNKEAAKIQVAAQSKKKKVKEDDMEL
eukprot:TRINITY_DN5695_c0_g1_i1.p1 TRINITY_DN5695_c0_g1~~TRINITY_DN5695_c0_g1_i1.p1  ORF type:complete len:168 (+),score=78.64 TRINITY_DN5695_c0_g1_i1:152-655(+)